MPHFATDRVDTFDRTVIDRRDPFVGSVVNERFRLDARIAAGGFGAIYRATHLPSQREVALKILHPDLCSDLHLLARFRREGSTLVRLRAPHTVTTYEYGETRDGMLFIVMELLHGQSLLGRLQSDGPVPWRDAVKIGYEVCQALAEAHSLGIVHRDLKPANIHLERRGSDRDYVKVLDFGVAKILRAQTADDDAQLTGEGQMIGTSDYMAPEQILGARCDGRCDIYTLGVVMYEAITGRRPFAQAANPAALLAALLTSSAPAMSSSHPVPPELDRVILRCLEREPGDRYANVAELAAALGRLVGAPEEVEAPTVVHRPSRPSQPPPPLDDRPSWRTVPTYDMTRAADRDAMVRRVVWALVFVIMGTLGIVAANVL